MHARLIDRINTRYRTSARRLGRYPVGEPVAGPRHVASWRSGRSGKGKTTLAERLRTAMPGAAMPGAEVVHTHDITTAAGLWLSSRCAAR
jgi:hypothetical protein